MLSLKQGAPIKLMRTNTQAGQLKYPQSPHFGREQC
ncbi:hypothetical protein AB210_0515 [Acinetobacter baumannii AB210]|nr:hypothetical protein AB210_0515 [Acinetobacter baumannii AB210]